MVAWSQSAGAYCRTTTCRPTDGHDCAKDGDDACVTEGAPLVWPSRCVGFSFQAQGSAKLVPEDTKKSILSAFASWSEHPCPSGGNASIVFSATDDVECKLPQANVQGQGPNVNVVFFRDDEWPYKGIDGTLATTTVSYDADGAIWDADIAVNSAFNDVTLSDSDVEYDVESIVVHEVGHFIGLAHSPDDEALMAPTYAPGALRRDLAEDDIAALCTVYPPDRKASCDLTYRNGFSSRCSETTVATTTGGGTSDGTGGKSGCNASGSSPFAALGGSAMLWVLAAVRRRSSSSKPGRS